MDSPEEIIQQGIDSIMKRDTKLTPLTQEELHAVIEHLVTEVNDPEVDESLAQYYLSCITFLKTKVVYN